MAGSRSRSEHVMGTDLAGRPCGNAFSEPMAKTKVIRRRVIEDAGVQRPGWEQVGRYMYCFGQLEQALSDLLHLSLRLSKRAARLLLPRVMYSAKLELIEAGATRFRTISYTPYAREMEPWNFVTWNFRTGARKRCTALRSSSGLWSREMVSGTEIPGPSLTACCSFAPGSKTPNTFSSLLDQRRAPGGIHEHWKSGQTILS
jgi:hypothetical protein